MCTVLLPLGENPIAVDKYINISNIKKYCKMGDLSDFQRGQNVGARLAGASVTKTATLLGLSRAAFSKVMATYTHVMGRHHQLRGIVKNQN